ncbi:hypothetical protein K6U06_20905 [Acidiferrimicrobium sp. IK]|uniref:hypothetical protein n=1 Tax=Acidiferrimicrobium sp. IK TaxID=2871700 RepID=UPI0021CB2EB4|nr:hypothetical protein [Acidiferrimicrobium sp. IK]MCU4186838.1 hypothetical protein [Acidiferrimicrobium sp. IK]
MVDDETVIAERHIDLGTDPLHVLISTDTAEGFWRVQVQDPASTREVSTTTMDGEDSFLWPLIRDALAGDAPSWQHLAHWGQGALSGRGPGLRSA